MPNHYLSKPCRACGLWLLLFAVLLVSPAHADDTAFAAQVIALNANDFKQKEAAVAALAATGHARTVPVLAALLDGNLYARKSDDRVVIATDNPEGAAIIDAATGEDLGTLGKRELKRISVNNTLRNQLRSAIARLSLAATDPATRLAAVNQLLTNLDPDSIDLLKQALPTETDEQVQEAMQLGLAFAELANPDPAVRLQAIEPLRGNLNPEARNRLTALIAAEQDAEVRAAAVAALAAIEQTRQRYELVETVFFGLSLGSVLLLAAIGLAITFGVMGVINMAHGELMMLGAYTTYVVQTLMPNHIGLSLFVAIPAAFLVAGLVGVAIERGVIRFLYGRPLETLLATFGISLFLQQVVRSIFSPLNRSVATPDWMSGSWVINSALSITYNRLYILIFALLVFAALLLILKKTPLGLQVRAVSQNRNMAKSIGVRTEWVDAMTFGLGAGIAGVAGVALSQLTNVGPNLGQAYIIDSFLVVVFGGVGNLWGTLVAAMSLGVINKFLEPFAGAVLAKILVLIFIILFIQKRPRGLFPQKGRYAEG